MLKKINALTALVLFIMLLCCAMKFVPGMCWYCWQGDIHSDFYLTASTGLTVNSVKPTPATLTADNLRQRVEQFNTDNHGLVMSVVSIEHFYSIHGL